jgi:hypothetical protein
MRSVLRVLLCVLLAVMGLLTACGDAPHPEPRPLPPYLAGVTVDDISDISGIISAERRFPITPVTRLYFDVTQTPAAYSRTVQELRPVSYLLGELLDSSDETQVSVAGYRRRALEFVASFGEKVDVWEVGNEVNGSWTGPYPVVSAKLTAGYDVVAARGLRTALTLYYNAGCGDGPGELDPLAFSRRYVPTHVRDGLTYVFVSYYPDECGYLRPTALAWTRFFAALHALYPRALVGFGEIGLSNPVTTATIKYAKAEIAYYYGLRVPLAYYVGGYFWWYYAEDRVRLAAALAAGFRAECEIMRSRDGVRDRARACGARTVAGRGR